MFRRVPQSVVGEGVEEEAAVAVVEGAVAEEAAEQVEGRMEAMMTEAEEGSGRKVGEGVAVGVDEGGAVGEACAPCWLGSTEQREVF